jgi:hypothetical protein
MSVLRILMTCYTFIILEFSLPFIFIARCAQLSLALPDCSKVSSPELYDLSEALSLSALLLILRMPEIATPTLYISKLI